VCVAVQHHQAGVGHVERLGRLTQQGRGGEPDRRAVADQEHVAVDDTVDELLHHGQEAGPHVERGLAAGHPRPEVAAPPGPVDLVEHREGGRVRPALHLPEVHLLHAVEHVHRQAVRRGDRCGGLLRPHRAGGVDGPQRPAGQPGGEPQRLRLPQLVER
jgi:hypothetical protein